LIFYNSTLINQSIGQLFTFDWVWICLLIGVLATIDRSAGIISKVNIRLSGLEF